MRKMKSILLILFGFITITGCWNYREIDEMSIVAGIAIDKGSENKVEMTVEIIEIGSGMDAKMTSKTLTSEGETMFDAARNIISLSGGRLYWSHAKVIILSKEIASQGVTRIIEWYNRDAEARESVNILISEGESAKEIFNEKGESEDVLSFELERIIKNQGSLSEAPTTDILNFFIESDIDGISTIIPVVKLKKLEGETRPQIMGTAIIKDDKLAGFLDDEETKALLFIRDEIEGGIFVEEIEEGDSLTLVSLEIYKNKTKVVPVVEGKDIKIELDMDTTVSIGEIQGAGNFFDEEGRIRLEQSIQDTLKKQIEALISKVQSEYDADIFGFGSKLREDKVKAWKSVSGNWEEEFKDLEVNVKTKVHIKNSGIVSKSIGKGE